MSTLVWHLSNGGSDRLVTRHTGIWREPLTPVPAQRTRTGLRLLPLCLHSFPFIHVFTFRTTKVPVIIRLSIFAEKTLSAALASANSWHLKKPQKIKRIKIEAIRGWVWEKGHHSPRPSSRFRDGQNMYQTSNEGFNIGWETGKSRKFCHPPTSDSFFLAFSKSRKQAMRLFFIAFA